MTATNARASAADLASDYHGWDWKPHIHRWAASWDGQHRLGKCFKQPCWEGKLYKEPVAQGQTNSSLLMQHLRGTGKTTAAISHHDQDSDGSRWKEAPRCRDEGRMRDGWCSGAKKLEKTRGACFWTDLHVWVKKYTEISLVVQWLRICLAMQRRRVQSLVGELRSHTLGNDYACTPQPLGPLDTARESMCCKGTPRMTKQRSRMLQLRPNTAKLTN